MLWGEFETRNGFPVISMKSGMMIGAMALTLTALLTGCNEAAEPQAIDDGQREQLTNLVQDSSWVQDATCSVQVFRQEGPVTYGWADCTNEVNVQEGQVAQSDSYPFRAEGDTIQVPAEGGNYAEDVRRIFPADLVTTIEQYSGMQTPSSDGS